MDAVERRRETKRFAAWDPPRPMRSGFASAWDGTRLYWEEYGPADGPAVILTDGIACNGTFWAYLLPELARTARVIRWTYRGHGLSELPGTYTCATVDDCIRDLESIMAFHGIGEAIHVGFSMGVQVLIDFAHRHPEACRALVLVGGGYGRVLDHFHGNTVLRSAFPFLYAMALGNRVTVEWLWRNLAPTHLVLQVASLTEMDGRLADRRHLAAYLEHVAWLDLELFLTMLRSAGQHDTRPFLKTVRCPALVVGGTRDTFSPFYLAESLAEALPDAELLKVRGGTHSMTLEQPDLVCLGVEAFLTRRKLLESGPAATRRRSYRSA